ncbi:MAG: hypothetical protein QM831_03225 [Kofleriaceae bacterium]
MARSKVAVIRVRPDSILDDLDRLHRLAGMALRPDLPTVIFANASAQPFPGTSTTPWQLEGVARAVHGAKSIVGVLANDPIAARYGIAIADPLQPLTDVNVVVLSTMNAKALVAPKRVFRTQDCAGLFAVMDGTTAGDSTGPVVKDVMLASTDPSALDAIAGSMMGIGHGDTSEIEVVGDRALAMQRWGFTVGGGGLLDRLVARAPMLNDYRYQLRDRQVFEKWREQTAWGQLFDRYQSIGTLATT